MADFAAFIQQGQEVQKVVDMKLDVENQIKKIKQSRAGIRGAMRKDDPNYLRYKKLLRDLTYLEKGQLPPEGAAAGPSTVATRSSDQVARAEGDIPHNAFVNARLHARAEPVPAGRPAVVAAEKRAAADVDDEYWGPLEESESDDGASDSASDSDSDDGDDDDVDEAELEQRLKRGMTDEQLDWTLRAIEKHRAKPTKPKVLFPPPIPRGDAAVGAWGLVPVVVWAPDATWADDNVPVPCPRKHGFDAKVTREGWIDRLRKSDGKQVPYYRRVFGVSEDLILVSPLYKCRSCETETETERRAITQRLKELGAAEKDSDEAKLLRKQQAALRYTFKAFDPGCTRLFAEKYPFVAEMLPAVVATQRVAITKDVAYIINRVGANATDLAKAFSEYKGENFESRRFACYSYFFFKAGACDGQPRAVSWLSKSNFPVIRENTFGITTHGVGARFIRPFFIKLCDESLQYQFAFRAQRVFATILSTDHTCKFLKSQHIDGKNVLQHVLVVFSNDLNAPLLVVHCATTSYSDPAVVAGLAAFEKNRIAQGHPPLKVLFCDAFRRDRQPIKRAIPSLVRDNAPEWLVDPSVHGFAEDAMVPAEAISALGLDGNADAGLAEDAEAPPAMASGNFLDSDGQPGSYNIRLLYFQSAVKLMDRLAAQRDTRNALKVMVFPAVFDRDDRKRLTDRAEVLGLDADTCECDGGYGIQFRCARREGAAAAGAGASAVASAAEDFGDLEAVLMEKIVPNWELEPIRADPIHWLRLFLALARSMDSPMYKHFASLASDCLFTICAGEKKRIIDHVTKLRQLRSGDDGSALVPVLSESEQWATIPHAFRRRNGKYVIEAPALLIPRFVSLFRLFDKLDCPKGHLSFFKPNAIQRFKSLMWTVYNGGLSDLPGLELYYIARVIKSTGFVVYGCMRGTNGLEGSNLHRRLTMPPTAMHASPRLLDAISNHHDWRVCVKALQVKGQLPKTRHFNMQRLDALFVLLGTEERQRAVLGLWVRTNYAGGGALAPLQHGSYYAKIAIAEEISSFVPSGVISNPPAHVSPEFAAFFHDVRLFMHPMVHHIQRAFGTVAARHQIDVGTIVERALSGGWWLTVDSALREIDNRFINQEGWETLLQSEYLKVSGDVRGRSVVVNNPLDVPASTVFRPSAPLGTVPSVLPLPLVAMGAGAVTGGPAARPSDFMLVPVQQNPTVAREERRKELDCERKRAARACESPEAHALRLQKDKEAKRAKRQEARHTAGSAS